jgi:hypothetical protein
MTPATTAPAVTPAGYRAWLAIASSAALACAACAVPALIWPPRWASLVALQRLETYKQLTGYVLIALLVFGLSLSLFKRWLDGPRALRALQLTHRALGLFMLAGLVAHAGFAHAGFLRATFVLTLVLVVAGGVPNLLTSRSLAKWGQWSTALHISIACIVTALALVHVYFATAYAG